MWDWLTPRAANLCLLTDPSVFWLRNASDFLIGAAYALIPFGLVSFLSERRDVQFGWLAWCFALFIALCGATHWMHIWLQFFPHDTAEAYLKAATALASVTTAGAVIGLLPDIKRLPTPAMMAREHQKRIQAEVAAYHFVIILGLGPVAAQQLELFRQRRVIGHHHAGITKAA